MENESSFFQVKRAPIILLIIVLLFQFGLATFINLVAFPNGYFFKIQELSNMWLNATLQANIINLIIIVGLILIVFGRFKLKDLYLKKGDLLKGLIGTFLFWIAIHVIDSIIMLSMRSQIVFNSDLVNQTNVVFGNLLGQIFGNALHEEIIFRGFLSIQFYLLIRNKMKSEKKRLLCTIFIPQALFVLGHIPNRIFYQYTGFEFVFDFIQLTLIGALFMIIFIQTKNLFFVVGVHALMNSAPMIIKSNHYSISAVICTVLFVCIYPLFQRKKMNMSNTNNLKM